MEIQAAWQGKLLAVTGVIVVILLLVGFFVQRSRTAAGQGVAFHVGEAGVHYVLHLLNSGTCSPAELVSQTLVHTVADEGEATPMGAFEATFEAVPSEEGERLHLRVLGRDNAQGGLCQSIEAEVESFAGEVGTKYRMVSWDHAEAVRCGDVTASYEFTCAGR